MPPSSIPIGRRAGQSGLTLIELLAAIAIIGILAAILLAAANTSRDSALLTGCRSNLRQIGAAMELYAIDNHGLYPAAVTPGKGIWSKVLVDAAYLDRRVLLCPGDTLNEAASRYANSTFAETGRSYTYCSMVMNNGTHNKETPLEKHMVEQPARQYMITEWHSAAFSWNGHGGEIAGNDLKAGSVSPSHRSKGRHFLFMDGHIEQRLPEQYQDNNSGWLLNNKRY